MPSSFLEQPKPFEFLLTGSGKLVTHPLDLFATVIENTTEFGRALHSPGYYLAYLSDINREWKLIVSQPAERIMTHFRDPSVEDPRKGGKSVIKNLFLSMRRLT